MAGFLHGEIEIPWAAVLEQRLSQLRADGPVSLAAHRHRRRGCRLAGGPRCPACPRALAVDVARQIEVELVLLDLLDATPCASISELEPLVEDIDDLVDVLLAQAVLGAVLHEAAAGVDHEDALAGVGVLLVDDDDAGGDAGAIEQVGRQADDALDVSLADRGCGGCRPRHCPGTARRAAGCTRLCRYF